MQETQFDSWVRKIFWRRDRLPTPVLGPGEFHGLYIVHGVAKSWTWLSNFDFHDYVWFYNFLPFFPSNFQPNILHLFPLIVWNNIFGENKKDLFPMLN